MGDYTLLLQATLADVQATGESSFAQVRSDINDLRKFVVLNYIAVIKAFKKRNRHLQVTCQDSLELDAPCIASFASSGTRMSENYKPCRKQSVVQKLGSHSPCTVQ